MKIIVSGATGFIGKHLVRRLVKDRHQVIALSRKSSNFKVFAKEKVILFLPTGNINDLIDFMKKEKVDGVVHLASLFLPSHKSLEVDELIKTNVLFSANLLEAAAQSSVSWFINTGTFWQHYKDKPYSPVNLYAATKQAFDDIAKYYVETSAINFVTLKLSDTFGPEDTRPKIFNLWSQISKTREVMDMSPGGQIIDINYIDNVIDGYIDLISLLSKDKDAKFSGKSFAIKAAERKTLKQLAEIFSKITGKKLNINWGGKPYRPREVMRPWSLGERIPGWSPKISLFEGIRRTFNEK